MAEYHTQQGFASLSALENRLLNKEQKKKLLKHDSKTHYINKKWFKKIVSMEYRALKAVEAKLKADNDVVMILTDDNKPLIAGYQLIYKPNPTPASNYQLVLRALESGHKILDIHTYKHRKLLTVNDIDRLQTPKVVMKISI